MIKSKITVLLFTMSMLLGAFSANAVCTGCTFEGPADDEIDMYGSFSAIVKQIIWYTNEYGQRTTRLNFTTLTGTTMTYCQQQLSAVMNSPGVTVVQFCQQD